VILIIGRKAASMLAPQGRAGLKRELGWARGKRYRDKRQKFQWMRKSSTYAAAKSEGELEE